MSFLQPQLLWVALLAVPLVLLYTSRRRRATVTVPALWLWRDLPQVARSRRRLFGRLDRRWMALALFLLALIGMTGAGAAPIWGEPAPGRDVIVIVDLSGSMGARGEALTRIEEARARARGLVRGLGPRDRLWLIGAGESPRVVVGPLFASPATPVTFGAGSATEDPRADDLPWERLLALEGAGLDLPTALNLAASIGADSRGARRREVWLLSDGDPAAERSELPPLPSGVALRYAAPPARARSLRVEAWLGREETGDLVLEGRLVNAGADWAQAVPEVAVDGAPYRRLEAVVVPPGAALALPAQRLPGALCERSARAIGWRLVGRPDDLALDDASVAVVARRAPLNVVVADPGADPFLAAALNADAGLRTRSHSPNAGDHSGTGSATRWGTGGEADAADAVWVATAPLRRRPARVLYLDPRAVPPDVGLHFEPRAAPSGPFEAQDHPALVGVELDGLLLPDLVLALPEPMGGAVAATGGGAAAADSDRAWTALATAGGAPLLLAREGAGGRQAALTFSPSSSDLVLRRAYPLLVSNLIRWLSGTDPAGARWAAVGASLEHPPEIDAVLAPDGDELPAGGGRARLERGPGVYRTQLRPSGGDAVADAWIAARALPAESDLRVRGELGLGEERVPWRVADAPTAIHLGGSPRAPWLLLALAVLCLEALLFHRGALP